MGGVPVQPEDRLRRPGFQQQDAELPAPAAGIEDMGKSAVRQGEDIRIDGIMAQLAGDVEAVEAGAAAIPAGGAVPRRRGNAAGR